MDLILPFGARPLFNSTESKQEIVIQYVYTPKVSLHDLEKGYIIAALKHFGCKVLAASALGITIKTMYNKLHEYGIFSEWQSRTDVNLDGIKNEVNFKHGTWEKLTKSQVDVALLMLKAKSNDQIAAELGFSRKTVDRYISTIYRKTKTGKRAEFIVKFSKTGQ